MADDEYFDPAPLEKMDPDEPVTLLNLIKFRERSLDGVGSGSEAYDRYGQLAIPQMVEHGGTILWAGEVRGAAVLQGVEGDWDFAALVRYPSPNAFLASIQGDRHMEALPHRINGCERFMVMPTTTTYSKLQPADE